MIGEKNGPGEEITTMRIEELNSLLDRSVSQTPDLHS